MKRETQYTQLISLSKRSKQNFCCYNKNKTNVPYTKLARSYKMPTKQKLLVFKDKMRYV